uniref:Bet v1-like protein n=1 Tax=Nodulisporium sp. TaxID=1897413 RepID=A0A2R4QF18_9PEZI|nr:Bet v1-like protein [Nodulisporium sp.]
MEPKLVPLSFTESAVINIPLDSLWPRLKLRDISKFYTAIKRSEVVESGPEQRDRVKWYFEDGTVLEQVVVECSDDEHCSSFVIVNVEPWGLPYAGAGSTIRAYPVTSGSAEGSTLVQWSAHYPDGVGDEVIADARQKRREGLADLAKAAENWRSSK